MTMDSAIVVGVAHIKVSQLQLVSDAARVGEFALALKKTFLNLDRPKNVIGYCLESSKSIQRKLIHERD